MFVCHLENFVVLFTQQLIVHEILWIIGNCCCYCHFFSQFGCPISLLNNRTDRKRKRRVWNFIAYFFHKIFCEVGHLLFAFMYVRSCK